MEEGDKFVDVWRSSSRRNMENENKMHLSDRRHAKFQVRTYALDIFAHNTEIKRYYDS